MTEKKQLNEEQLQKATGGEELMDDYYCSTCKRATKSKMIYTTVRGSQAFARVCSICEKQY